MQMNLQVFAIGEIESGKSATSGREWNRRRFQCFDHGSQQVGAVVAYGTKEELEAHKESGQYVATVTVSQGDNAIFDFRITQMQLVKKSDQQKPTA
jgi:hypothetical protein